MVSKAPWIRWAIGLLLVVAATVATVHHYYHTQPQRDGVNTPYLYLVKLEHFAELGEAGFTQLDLNITPDTSGRIVSKTGGVQMYNATTPDSPGSVRGDSNKVITIPLLAFAVSKEKREEWKNLAADIQEAKKAIDPELYGRFQEVVDLHQQHPWPNVNDHEKIMASDWNSEDLSETWIDKNHHLRLLVQRELALRGLPQS
jgi:hypothetical protein